MGESDIHLESPEHICIEMIVTRQICRSRRFATSLGFTLIKPLFVTAIPALLTALARANRSRRLADGWVVCTAMMRYRWIVGFSLVPAS